MVTAVENTCGSHREFLENLFDVGVKPCKPQQVLPPLLLKHAPVGRVLFMISGGGSAPLAANEIHGCFKALGDLVITGPTRTDINDIRVVLVDPQKERVNIA